MDYTRKGHTITEVESGKAETHFTPSIKEKIPSINAAKRASRDLQKAGHTVRVIK
jgi:hypothetical protein